ncbi:MAG: hypothetical protein C0597_14635 [Marinilabiliales bacterium]|nr:MAG: hypothetical protein C0597_14635 [Marinilabiliales bacterium]
MKNILVIILVLTSSLVAVAQDVTTVSANEDISENLNLEAIASIFGESKDLEDFEYKLNDPELKISNLDLNRDGYVDYLRVVENSEGQTFLITIQAVIGKDIYQDVATIDVEKDHSGKTHVQVVGDVYLYGPDYIIEPVYVYSPPVVLYFWGPTYHRWHSPYYWQHYPVHYHSWHPYSCNMYYGNIHLHVNHQHIYYYPGARRSSRAYHMHTITRRNDYGRTYPERSFTSRNRGVRNSYELSRVRGESHSTTRSRSATAVKRSNTRVGNTTHSRNSGSLSSERSSNKSQRSSAYSNQSRTRSGQVNRPGNSRTYNNRQVSERSERGKTRNSNSSTRVHKQSRNSHSANRNEGRSRNAGSGNSTSNERSKRR